ncbi:MAG TPA: hypothetical protein VFA84_15780 [Acidimicrobiales bacterium]|nr:hypothetical protein [Acidimicrobiales bacterium]
MDWVGDAGPDPIPAGLLDRVMYLGSPTTARDGTRLKAPTTGPQAHLAVQGAATDPLPPHFHGVDQFQLFVAGSGTVGGHAVGPGVVHYADRNSVYGPLRPGPDGMAYATLRPEHDPGASFMPAAQAELAERLRAHPGPRRNLTVHLDGGDGGGWRDAEAAPDGLRIATYTAPAGSVVEVGVVGGGAYVGVLEGTVAAEGAGGGRDSEARGAVGRGAVGRGAVAWCAPGAHRVVAGDRGAVLVLLQFPARAEHAPTLSDA